MRIRSWECCAVLGKWEAEDGVRDGGMTAAEQGYLSASARRSPPHGPHTEPTSRDSHHARSGACPCPSARGNEARVTLSQRPPLICARLRRRLARAVEDCPNLISSTPPCLSLYS